MKTLFVGDLSGANNYGAIATSNALINLLKENKDIKIFETIGYKSLYNDTSKIKIHKSQSFIKHMINRMIMFFPKHLRLSIRTMLGIKSQAKPITFIPYRVDQYEDYAKKAVLGEILQYEVNLIKQSELIIINGEGNIVNGTDQFGMYRCGARYILFFAYLAKHHFKKKVCIINHTVDPKNSDAVQMIKFVYPMLDWISVREKKSLQFVKNLDIDCNLSFNADALFSYRVKDQLENRSLFKDIDISKPFICIGDSSGIQGQMSKVKWDVHSTLTSLIENMKTVCPQIVFVDGYNGKNKDINRVIKDTNIVQLNLKNCSFQDLSIVLGKAQLFISGRWHASIMACLNSTPFILWGADSVKTLGLNDLYGYPSRFFDIDTLPIHIADIVEEAKRVLEEKNEIQTNMNKTLNILQQSSQEMIEDVVRNVIK